MLFTVATLDVRDFSYAVSGFCHAFFNDRRAYIVLA